MTRSYAWKPIALPAQPEALAVPELLALGNLWREQRARLKRTGADQRFMDRLVRRWSIETGIIERLYELSEGATQLLVQQGFDAALIAHNDTDLAPDELIRILEDHRQGIDFAMDVVGGTRDLSVSWIKALHQLLTRHQATTRAMLPDGRMIDVPLRRGEFKQQPNNPSGVDGQEHEYCPPEHVAAQMDQLITLYNQLPAIPEVRSAWLHHAFAQIHPFQDGNGRVARVLASIDFLKAGLFPLLVVRTEKADYIDALRAADDGDLQPLVTFFAEAQKRMLMRGFSEAEQAVSNVTSLDTVLQAAQQKLQAREHQARSQRDEMVRRLDGFADLAQSTLTDRAGQVRASLPQIKTHALRCKDGTHHWYRAQIIELAQRHEYWADLHEPRRWARLDLRNGDKVELVISLHFIGNPATGAAMATAFVIHRQADEKVGDRLPVDTAAEPLLLAPTEDQATQKTRFLNWLERAVVQGLAIWQKVL